MGEGDEQVAEDAQQRLLDGLAERSRVPEGSARHAALEAEIADAAAALGLEPSEVDGLPVETVEAERRPASLTGRFRVMRRARDIMPFFIGLMLAPMLAGLGAPAAGAGLAAAVIVGWVIRSRRRVAVFVIEPSGDIDFGRHGRVAWPDVDEVSFRYRYPWLSVDIERAANEVADIRIVRRSAKRLRLARGQLFRVKPIRRPIGWYQVSKLLKAQARAAGLKARSAPGKGAWRAGRPA